MCNNCSHNQKEEKMGLGKYQKYSFSLDEQQLAG